MVHIKISKKDSEIILDCEKCDVTNQKFQLIIDAKTYELINPPIHSDIDMSCAYSCVYHMLINNETLPLETYAAWG